MVSRLRRRSALIGLMLTLVCPIAMRWGAAPTDRLSASEPAVASAPAPLPEGAVRIAYQFQIGDIYHYVIEDEIVDDVAILTPQFRLPSTTTVRAKRSIVQSVLPAAGPTTAPGIQTASTATRPAASPVNPAAPANPAGSSGAPSPASAPGRDPSGNKPAAPDSTAARATATAAGAALVTSQPVQFGNHNPPPSPRPPTPVPPVVVGGPPAPANGARVEWVCDRFEIREQVLGMKEVSFDSLRDTHPPADLSGLARVNNTRIEFRVDGATGAAGGYAVTPGAGAHPSVSRQSKTAEKCLFNPDNLQELHYAMGGQFLPNHPVRPGEQWTISRTREEAPFGTVTTRATCTLKSVNRVGDADIATIDLSGVLTFVATPPKPPAAPVQPPRPAPPAVQPPRPTPTTTQALRGPTPAARPPTTQPASAASRPVFTTTQPGRAVPPPVRPGPHPTPHTTQPARPTPAQPTAPTSRPASPGAAPTRRPVAAPTTRPITMQTSPPSTMPTTRPISTAPLPATSRPVVSPQAASRPVSPSTQPRPVTTAPTASAPAKPTEEPFKMERSLLSGTIKFDVTHGRLVDLTLRSDMGFGKLMHSDQGDMKIKQGSAQTLRIHGSTTPPPRPIIQGGPKPPVEPEQPGVRPPLPPPKPTTRSTQPNKTPVATQPTTRPVAGTQVTPALQSQPKAPVATSRPAGPIVAPRHGTPSTQPGSLSHH